MAKTIKGSELIKRLEDNELKVGQKFKFISTICRDSELTVEVIQKDNGLFLQNTEKGEVLSTGWLINSTIEIIEEEQQDIDIEEIKEMSNGIMNHTWEKEKINELIKAVKQLDREINKLKEK